MKLLQEGKSGPSSLPVTFLCELLYNKQYLPRAVSLLFFLFSILLQEVFIVQQNNHRCHARNQQLSHPGRDRYIRRAPFFQHGRFYERGGRDDLSSDMFKWPETARGFLAFLLWWTHILEADFCCIILKICFHAKVYFFVISYFGAKGSGCGYLGAKEKYGC